MAAAKQKPPSPRMPAAEVANPVSAMVPRFNFVFRWFARRFFRHFNMAAESAAQLRACEGEGAVIYVMRYASRLDYFLFNALFLREGLRLSAGANGISFYYYQPLWRALPQWFARRRKAGALRRAEDKYAARRTMRGALQRGESVFLFLRTERFRARRIIGLSRRSRRRAMAQRKRELNLLDEAVKAIWPKPRAQSQPVTQPQPEAQMARRVSLVPLALFWRKGPRTQRRFLNLGYGAAQRPSDFAKVLAFLLTWRHLAIKVGAPINLSAFAAERRAEGPLQVARKVRRAMQLFLFREERAVQGPVLRPRARVQAEVLAQHHIKAAIQTAAKAAALKRYGKGSVADAAALAQMRQRAARHFNEIAADMNATTLAALAAVCGWLFRKLFGALEARGLERVAALAKRHPVVLVPSHRSYLDFLLLSWLMYQHDLIPPHIAARENMAFGPFGFLFRRAGAFFLRRSFSDPLYKAVFRGYVAHLVGEGFPQEFFIEGGRSRSGRSLAPRMGMLSWNVQAFADSGRREMYFIPVAITYERLVEEGALQKELGGKRKRTESMAGLLRARKLLKHRFGQVFLHFGEPLSLAQQMQGRRALFANENGATETPQRENEKRAFTEQLGFQLVERINNLVVANATSVAACALLGGKGRGIFGAEFSLRMNFLTELLRAQKVRLSKALLHDAPDFAEAREFLVRAALAARNQDPRGEIISANPEQTRALDVYRNVLLHFLAAPSFAARRLLQGAATREQLQTNLQFWLQLFYDELFAPPKAQQLQQILAHFLECGAVEFCNRGGANGENESALQATQSGTALLACAAEQSRALLESYYIAVAALAETLQPGAAPLAEKALLKTGAAQFHKLNLLGEVRRAEAWNPVGFKVALSALGRRGYVKRAASARADGAAQATREANYLPGPAHQKLPALQNKLAAALRES